MFRYNRLYVCKSAKAEKKSAGGGAREAAHSGKGRRGAFLCPTSTNTDQVKGTAENGAWFPQIPS